MRPAFSQALGELSDAARAVIEPSAARVCQTKWKESVVPQMSAPPPWIVQVPPDNVWAPVGDGLPMSPHVHPLGQDSPGGGYSVALTATESRVTAPATPWLWEVRANPPSTGPVMGRATVEPGTAVQLVPSGEVYAVNRVWGEDPVVV